MEHNEVNPIGSGALVGGSSPRKFITEILGTLILLFFGVGLTVLMGEHIGILGTSLAFRLSIVAAAYGTGPISGAHLNAAVSFGMMATGRVTGREAVIHRIAPNLVQTLESSSGRA